MPAYLHRTTLIYRPSVSEPDITDPANWIKDPDLSAVLGIGPQYWKIAGDLVVAMSQAERNAVDAAALTRIRDAAEQELQEQENILRAFMLLVLDELNAHSAKVNAILTAIDGAASLAALKTAIAAIADLPSRTESQLRTAIRGKLGT